MSELVESVWLGIALGLWVYGVIFLIYLGSLLL